MLALVAMLLGLLAPQEQTDAEGRTVIRDYRRPANGISRCLRNLPERRRIAVDIICRVNSIGGPTACTFDPDTTREERYAAECVSRGYSFRWEDGTPASGATVGFTITLITP